MSYQGLEKPVALFNEWPYRSADAVLASSSLTIELADFAIFWQQFLGQLPSLRKAIRAESLNALREISGENVGPSFQKAMDVLDRP